MGLHSLTPEFVITEEQKAAIVNVRRLYTNFQFKISEGRAFYRANSQEGWSGPISEGWYSDLRAAKDFTMDMLYIE